MFHKLVDDFTVATAILYIQSMLLLAKAVGNTLTKPVYNKDIYSLAASRSEALTLP